MTCSGSDVLFTKAGAFIAGESAGGKNYRFEKVLLGPQGNLGQAALGSILRRVSGENLPLMKVNMNGDSVTYYANKGQHIFVSKLDLPPLFLPEMGIRRMWRFCQKEIPSCSAMYRAEAPSRWIRIPSSAGWGRGTAIRR